MINFLFTIDGHPQPKQRARKGKYGNFYTPKKTVDYEQKIQTEFIKTYRNKLDDGKHKWRLVIHINIVGKRHPDLDNIIKIVKDALQSPRRKYKKIQGELRGCIWHNDSQVHTIEAHLRIGKKEGIDIYAEPTGRLG